MVLIFLVIVSSVSAITMRRSHTFVQNEEVIYDFLGNQYAITVKQIVGGTGRVLFEVNGKDEKVERSVPAVFQDMKVTIGEMGPFEVELKFLWDKEDTDPDATVQLAENFRKVVSAKGKRFNILVEDFDDIKRKATIDVNGQEVVLGELDKVILKDGSILRSGEIKGYNTKIIDLMIWATDEAWDYDYGETFDFQEKLSESEQKVVQVKGVKLNIEVEDISKEGVAKISIDDEKLTLKEDERATLENGIEVKVSHVSIKIPPSLFISLNVPDELRKEETSVTVERVIGMNQRDEFESEDYTVVTRFVELNKEDRIVVVNVNGKNDTLKVGDTGRSGDIQFTLKILNENAYPPKLILSFVIPKKDIPEPDEPRACCLAMIADCLACAEGVTVDQYCFDNPETIGCESEEMEEDLDEVEDEIEELDDLSEQEIPEPELPEEKETKVLTLKESTMFVLRKIGSFFTNLF